MNFTKEQTLAFKAEGNNFLISAGAGSGKTQVLSERVRYLIEEKNYHINEFLILTFTELAAGEMKQRIRKKLIDINSYEADKIDNADICTFDSYALSIVKKYHYLLDLPKNIKIIDSNVIKIITKKEIIKYLDNLYNENNETLINFVNRFLFKNQDSLIEIITQIIQSSINAIDSEEYLNDLETKHSYQTYQNFLIDYNNLLDELFNDYINSTQIIENEKVLNDISIFNEKYNSTSSLDEKVSVIKSKFPAIRNAPDKISKVIIDTKKNEIKDLVELYTTENDFIENYKIDEKFNHFLIDISREILKIINQYKKENNAFEFIDIAKFAIQILKENKEIALTIKNSLKTIMIDEYQDTSKIQEEFISYISNNNVYMVGDVKQSIYRFRKATPELFIEKFNNYQFHNGGELICLPDNFRSRKEMLKDINNLFSVIMSQDMGGANYKKDHMIISGNKSYEEARNNQEYRTEIINYDKSLFKENEYELEARIIAEDIINKINNDYMVWNDSFVDPKLRKATLKDFCILCPDGVNFFRIKKIFKEYKIPLFVQNNIDIADSQVVFATSSLLNFINQIKLNDLTSNTTKKAFISILRSYIFKLDDEEIYKMLQNGINTSPLYHKIINFIKNNENCLPHELIYNLIFEFEMYEKLPLIGDISINEKNIDNFLNIIDSLKELNFSLQDYIDYFNEILELELKIDVSSSSSDVDAVRLMNIFKSKGLEFPIIYCMSLNKGFNKTEYTKDFLISNKYGIIFPLNHEKSILYKFNKHLEFKEELSEKIRILYVALTRAKEKIFCLNKLTNTIYFDLNKADSLSYYINMNLDLFINSLIEPNSFNNLYFEQETNNINQEKLTYEEINITPIIKQENKHASKKLSFNANDELLLLGEHLHSILEYIDFNNPDLSIILDPKEKNLISNFLNSKLIKDLKNPIFFKEYEFIDDNIHGIIDCLIIDENNALIIDYKLKNINDENYKKQLKVYYDYVLKHFKIAPKCYLYSLVLGIYEEINC